MFIVIQRGSLDYEKIRMLAAITNVLEAMNYSVNFYLYCATNGEMRESIIRNFNNFIGGYLLCNLKKVDML